jgi:hypothetical protein
VKVIIVNKVERRQDSETTNRVICGIALDDDQVINIINAAIASRENSQRLESWIHPTILFFTKEVREVGVYNSHSVEKVWTKEKGFINGASE